MAYKITQHRRGTLEEWRELNLVPAEGELIIVEFGGYCKCKVGDGKSRFKDLKYIDDQTKYGIQSVLNAITESIKFLTMGGGMAMGAVPSETTRMAAAVIAIIPILIIYPFFQEYFVKGITMGAVKG